MRGRFRAVQFVRLFDGDMWGGLGAEVAYGCRISVTVHNVTPTSVVRGPYCIEAGAVFAPGIEYGEVLADGPIPDGAGQVGC